MNNQCEVCKKEFKWPIGIYNHKKLKHHIVDEELKKAMRDRLLKTIRPIEFDDPAVKAVNPVLILPKKPKVTFEVPLCQIQGYEIGREVQVFGKPVYQKKFRKLPAVYFYSEADNNEIEVIHIKRAGRDIDLEIPIPNHKNITFKRRYYTDADGLYQEE